MKFYQACYGKPNKVKWELYNTSPDIPMNICDYFERLGNRNTPQNIPKSELLDTNGNNKTLKIYEITSQDNVVCVSQTLFEAHDLDVQGRRKMMAQGFLFERDDEVLKNPNNILSISDGNFKFGMEETENISEILLKDKEWNILDAMKESGISENRLISLTMCVYALMESTLYDVIYLVSSQKENIMKPVIFCIYSAMPYSFRYLISFSSADKGSNSQFRYMTFVNEIPENAMYFNLDTGETNVDTYEITNNTVQYPFLSKLQEVGIEAFELYCEELQSELVKMQIPNTTEYRDLITANTLMQGEKLIEHMNEKELIRFVLELSAGAPIQNEYVDKFFTKLVQALLVREIMPNDVMMKRLGARADRTTVSSFSEEFDKLRIRVVLSSGEEAVIEFLKKQKTKGIQQFNKWRKIIENEENGRELISKYYIAIISKCNSIEQIQSVYQESKSYFDFKDLKNAISKRMYMITREKLKIVPTSEHYCVDVLDEYHSCFMTMFPNHESTLKKHIDNFCKYYWDNYRFDKFSFEEVFLNNYICMELPGHPNYEKIKQLLCIYDLVDKSYLYERRKVIAELEEYLVKIEKSFESQTLKDITPIVQTFLVTNLRNINKFHFVFWYNVANLGNAKGMGTNPYQLMMEWNLRVICDDECFEDALESPRLEKQLDKFISEIEGLSGKNGLLDELDPELEEYEILKSRLKSFKGLDKAIRKERKKRQREIKKMGQKDEKSREKYESEEFFDNEDSKGKKPGFSLFGKKNRKK